MEITPTVILAIIVIIFLVRDIIQTFFIQKSVPLDKVRELVAELNKSANATPSTLDNRAVELLEFLVDMYVEEKYPDEEEPPTPPQAIVTVTNNAPLG